MFGSHPLRFSENVKSQHKKYLVIPERNKTVLASWVFPVSGSPRKSTEETSCQWVNVFSVLAFTSVLKIRYFHLAYLVTAVQLRPFNTSFTFKVLTFYSFISSPTFILSAFILLQISSQTDGAATIKPCHQTADAVLPQNAPKAIILECSSE